MSQIGASGSKALALQTDVSNAVAVKALFDKVEAPFGGVDVLVNNAGIMELAALAQADD